MTSYIIRRLLLGVLVLILVSIMIFVVMHSMLPGDPLVLYLGGEDYGSFSQETLDALRHEYKLDLPLITQYFLWIGGLFKGDFGESIVYQRDVSEMIAQALPVTLHLGVLAVIISAVFGVTFGVICAIRRGKWMDTVFSVIANLGITLPNFWVGILLIYVFALKLGVLPTYGYTSPFQDFWLHIRMLIMPVFCLAIFGIAALTRQTRSSMLEVIQQDYVRTAWSKGLRERIIITRHIIKNGLIPVATTLGMQIGHLVGGAVLVEVVFNIPGVGRLMKEGVLGMDYQVVQGSVLITAVVVVLINILTDIAYGWIDPRIRYS